MPQFSDIPQGATVVHAPGYSDLPDGAEVVEAESPADKLRRRVRELAAQNTRPVSAPPPPPADYVGTMGKGLGAAYRLGSSAAEGAAKLSLPGTMYEAMAGEPSTLGSMLYRSTPVSTFVESYRAEKDVQQQPDLLGKSRAALSGLGKMIGPADIINPTMEEAARGPMEGVTAGTLGLASLLALKGKGAGRKTLDNAAASDRIVTALAPSHNPMELPILKKNVPLHLDDLKATADSAGIKVKTLDDAARVARTTADADQYRVNRIEPHLGVDMDVPPAYKGNRTDYGRATIADVDKRISVINDTLYPRFQKGGQGSQSAQAAIGAEQAQALLAEGSSLRWALAKKIAQITGDSPDAIYAERARYGRLNDLADSFRLAAEEQYRSQAVETTTPTTIGARVSGGGVTHEGAFARFPINPRNWGKRTLADRVISEAFNKYKPAVGNIAAQTFPETAGTAAGATSDTALYNRARVELGPKATISQITRRAQELKTKR